MSCIFSMLFISSKSSSTVSPPLFIHMAKHSNSCTYTQYSGVKQSTFQVIQLSMWKFYSLGSVYCSCMGVFFPCMRVHCKKYLEFLDFFTIPFWHWKEPMLTRAFCAIQRKDFFAVLPFWPWIWDPGWVKNQDLDPGSGSWFFTFTIFSPKTEGTKT